MCGIAGIVSFTSDYRPSPDELAKMSQQIAHRGPDGEGTLFFNTATAGGGFAHRRLAILDPDPRSNQPFSATYQGRAAHLIYNGEIYNYRELRKRLETELPNYPWRTAGDTEVLLAAYFAYGANCVDHFLGMFAFAIFDEAQGSLLLARDRLGQKPLYVAEANGKVAFASELGAVAALAWPDRSVSTEALTHYFSFGYIPAPHTIYTGIQKLPPAATRHFTALPTVSAKANIYYDPNQRNDAPPDPVSATRLAVEAAVASQLVSDVPLGCFLSGGIDSAITTLCAARALQAQGKGPLLTFTARFDDPRYDESPHAAEVAAHLGTKHLAFTIYPKAAEDLPLLARRYGEPFADSSALPSYYLSRETRNHVKVALSGDGGDELFAGYDRYRAMRLAERIRPLAWALPPLPTRGHPKSKVTRVARFLNSAHLASAQRYESLMRLFPAGTFTTPPLTGTIGGHAFPPGHLVDAAMQLDRLTYLPDDLLTKLDRASMACALEVRCPFMDHHLVSLAASIPAKTHLTQGKKSLLKQAFSADLPASVFSRPKSGFAVPIGDWFRGPLRDMLTDTLLSPNAFNAKILPRESIETLLLQHQHGTDHSQRLYALLMLELWHGSK